jgi:ribosomal protein S18 acetylase RimI-like enzyme
VNVRPATEADFNTLRELYREFSSERPPPSYRPLDWDKEWAEIEEIVRGETALLAEEDGSAVGLALARRKADGTGYLSDLYVRPQARRRGVARKLLREVVQRLGVDVISLDVDVDNQEARALYERLGFRPESLELVAETAALAARLEERGRGRSFGAVHVQTDEQGKVERAVSQFLPRIGRSGGTVVSEPRNGWTSVYDQLCDRNPELLRRLARELTDRMGAVVVALGVEEGAVVRYVLYDRGRVVDEYLSVPDYYGPLPPGDVVGLAANPTVVARLTGADPARVRAVARTAASPDQLPPASELVAELGELLGLGGIEYGYPHEAT